jgi:hypothetical protein
MSRHCDTRQKKRAHIRQSGQGSSIDDKGPASGCVQQFDRESVARVCGEGEDVRYTPEYKSSYRGDAAGPTLIPRFLYQDLDGPLPARLGCSWRDGEAQMRASLGWMGGGLGFWASIHRSSPRPKVVAAGWRQIGAGVRRWARWGRGRQLARLAHGSAGWVTGLRVAPSHVACGSRLKQKPTAIVPCPSLSFRRQAVEACPNRLLILTISPRLSCRSTRDSQLSRDSSCFQLRCQLGGLAPHLGRHSLGQDRLGRAEWKLPPTRPPFGRPPTNYRDKRPSSWP